MTDIKIIEVVSILIIADTVIGFLAAAKNHRIKSAVGRLGFSQKLAEIIIMVSLTFLTRLDPIHFPSIILSILYGILGFFEVTSIVENARVLGIDISFLTKYFETSGQIEKVTNNTEPLTPDKSAEKLNEKLNSK